MHFRGFDKEGLWYLKVIGVLMILIGIMKMSGCGPERLPDGPVKIRTASRAFTGSITSVEHDGHLFVLWISGSGGAGALLHSPSCPCHKTAEQP